MVITKRGLARPAVLSALVSATTLLPVGAQPVFRSGTEAVSISVSVKRGNVPLPNLVSTDFRLLDNGVVQAVDAFSVESVPLDLTLVVDTSGSTAGALDRMAKDVVAIGSLMRPDDQFRLLTIGVAINTVIPWQRGALVTTPTLRATSGVSLVYDALFAALAHTPGEGRRHLVIALTDGRDCGSVIDGEKLLATGGVSEAVLHWIVVDARGAFDPQAAPAWCTPLDGGAVDYVRQTVERSGGARHTGLLGDPTVRTFKGVLSDFRQSYVLRYSPRGVDAAGWHTVKVEVPSYRDVRISARAGYLSGSSR